MAQVQWIKLMVNLFEHKKIKRIQTLPNGPCLIMIWLHLLCLAGSTNDEGKVYFTRDIPYTQQTLACQLRQPLAIVRQALKVFGQYGMIEQSQGIIHIRNWQKYQNIEGLDKIREQTRARVIRHRENKKSALNSCSVTVTHCNATDKDIDKDLEKDQEEERALAAGAPREKKVFVSPSLDEVTAYCLQRNNHVNPLKFIAHYETRGWMAGRIRMRSWQAAIQAWEQNGYDKRPEEEEEVIWAMDRGREEEEEEVIWA